MLQEEKTSIGARCSVKWDYFETRRNEGRANTPWTELYVHWKDYRKSSQSRLKTPAFMWLYPSINTLYNNVLKVTFQTALRGMLVCNRKSIRRKTKSATIIRI